MPQSEQELSRDIGEVVGRVCELWRRAKDLYGNDEEITGKLDRASGLLDEVWSTLHESEHD